MTEAEKFEASGVSIKIPPFWFDKPEIWFYQVEAQFKICRITSEETMFSYLVAQLEPRVLDDIWDIVKDPNPNKYSAAKERLFKIFVESENKKIKRLLTGIQLGDMLRSQLLRKMRALAGTDVSEKALRTLWLDKMPDSVKCIAIVSEEHLDKIAAMADKIVEMEPGTIDVAAVQKDSIRVDQLMAKIATLEGQIASLKLQRKFRSPIPNHHQRSRSRSKSRHRYNPQGRYCFYHFRFGKKCLPGKCLLIDLHNRKLIDGVKNLSIKGEVATVQEINDLRTVNRASKYFNLLNSYPDLTKPNLVNRVVKHGVKHHILTTGQPVYSKARQLAPDKLKLAKQEFQFMLDNDIIRPSKSPWEAYYQIPIAEKDKGKTAITTPFGSYEFNTMSFGLRNAPSTFQRFITEVLYGLDFVFPYLNDVLVASSSEEEHSEHLKMVFERFQQYGLRINISKSVMGADQVEYLGFLITAEGSRPLPEEVQAISNYKLLETIHDLRTFLGAKKKDRRKVHWTDDTRRSFEKCKTDLAEAALLSFPRSGLPLSLCTDASDFAVGAVLNNALSRIESISEINFDAIAEEQTRDEELQKLLHNNSLKFKPSTLPSGKKLWCDISTPKIRPYIPQKFRFQMFQLIHGLAHPGIKSTVKLMTEKYVWSAEIVGRAFYEKWICRFGVPAKLVTDQGRQFEAELFRSIAAICGAKVAHTTSYHPQCNGKVERLHRTMKGAIKAHNNSRWTESLLNVLLGLRAAIRPDISYTIAQMVYGTSITLSGEFFDPPTINMDPHNFVAKLQQHMAELKPLKSPSNRKQNIFVHKDLKTCSHVFIRIDRVKKR
ncbi:hypothetical protein TNCV_2242071 [Trichonephila clavipes]|nr:hypothetical protein TNCV_2242071 [Trichonephila clavipes]